LIERFRGQMNLIGRGDATVHFEDSAKGLSGLSPTGRWADLGSGAGFPGVMFAALYPDVTLELVDSRMKRTIFLDKVVAEGGAENTTVKCCRVETLPADSYDGVMYWPMRIVYWSLVVLPCCFWLSSLQRLHWTASRLNRTAPTRPRRIPDA
jgi:hypothetical protein